MIKRFALASFARRDGTLQSHSLMLPKAYDPAKAGSAQTPLPLFVELHGAGNPHPLVWLSSRLGRQAKALDLLGYETPKSYDFQEHRGAWGVLLERDRDKLHPFEAAPGRKSHP